jgi:hypothetical protein
MKAPQGRKEHSCSCHVCKAMCQQSPCFPTPEQVTELMKAGYTDRLAVGVYRNIGEYDYPVIMPAKKPEGGCTFLTEAGLCELHDKGLKPLEGRLASHDAIDNGLRLWIARKWLTPAAQYLLVWWLERMGKPK